METPSRPLPAEVARAAEDPQRRFGADARYVILREAGAGGCGRVLEAYDTLLARRVAIKGLYRLDPESVERFQREARLAARLQHPGIVGIHDVGESDGHPFIVMDFVEGAPLQKASLDKRAKVVAIRDAARAVHFAHTQGVLHRDLKPSNLMVTPAGAALVMDFGLAREVRSLDSTRTALTATGDVLGTPQYMAPEQAQGLRALDARTDVYGLGATLYHLLSGRYPHGGDTVFEILRSVVERDPPPPGVDPDLDKIVLKAMEKDPARRYLTAEALAEDLDRWLRGDPVTATRPTLTYRLRKRIRRNPWAWAGMAAAGIALASGSAFAVSQAIRNDRQRRALLLYQEAQSSFHAALLDILAGGSAAEAHMVDFERKLGDAKRLDPDFDRGHFERAQYWRLAGDEAKARQALDAGLALEPEHPLGRMERGLLAAAEYQRLFDDAHTGAIADEARRSVEEGRRPREVTPQQVEETDPRLRGLRERAVADLQAGIAAIENAEPPWVRLSLARLDLLQGDPDRAAARIQDLEFAAAKVLKGRIAEARGDLEAAEQAYTDAIVTNRRWWEAYEARGSLRLESGFEAWNAGDDSGRALVEQALADWSHVAAEQPRRLSGLLGKARAARRLGQLLSERGIDPTAILHEGLAVAEAARALDPASSDARSSLAMIYEELGEWKREHGGEGDPSEDFRRALDLYALAPPDAGYDALLSLGRQGYLHTELADFLLDHGQDPTAEIDQAIRAFHDAIARNPGFKSVHHNLGITLEILAKWRASQGEDPTDPLRRAIDAYDGEIALDPDQARSYAARGNAYRSWGDWLARHRRSPAEPYRLSVDSYEAALRLNDRYANAHYGLGNACWRWGVWEASRDGEPTPHLRRAIEAFDRAAELNPNSPPIHCDRANPYMSLGEWEAAHGHDPTELYQSAVESYDRAIAAKRDYALPYANRAYVHLRWAEWEFDQGGDPRENLRRSVESADQALAINPRMADVQNHLGGAHAAWGDWQIRHDEDPSENYGHALAAYDAALALNPADWQPHANKGNLLKSMGRWADALAEYEAAYAIVGDRYPPLREWINEARRHVQPEY